MRSLIALVLVSSMLAAADPPRTEVPPGSSTMTVMACRIEPREAGPAGRLVLEPRLDASFRRPILAWAKLTAATAGGVSILPAPAASQAEATRQRELALVQRRISPANRAGAPGARPSLAFSVPAALPAMADFAGEVCFEASTGESEPASLALVAGQPVEHQASGGPITARLAPDAPVVVVTCSQQAWAAVEGAELVGADGAVLHARIEQQITGAERTMTYTAEQAPAALRLTIGGPRVLVRVPFAFTGVAIAAP